MAYPASIDDFTAKVDDVDDVMAADINELQTAAEAIETELGTDPAGSCTDVTTRLAHSINNAGWLEFDAATELTISSGAITVAQNFHKIDTESDAASDDLDTISGGTAGLWVVFRLMNAARFVVFKHGVDNIYCAGGVDITLSVANQFAFGIYDAALSKWYIGLAGGLGGSLAAAYDFGQKSSSAAIPVVKLEQLDVDDVFVNFVGTSAADQTKSISTINGDGTVEGPKNFSAAAGWAFAGMLRHEVNGTEAWIPYYIKDLA
jgi:hypothetical protein